MVLVLVFVFVLPPLGGVGCGGLGVGVGVGGGGLAAVVVHGLLFSTGAARAPEARREAANRTEPNFILKTGKE